MSKRVHLLVLDAAVATVALGAAAALTLLIHKASPDYSIYGDSETARVTSLALFAAIVGLAVNGLLETFLSGVRSSLVAAALRDARPERRFIPRYVIEWPVRPGATLRLNSVFARSMRGAMRRTTSPLYLRYLNWKTPADMEIAYDLQPTVWRIDRRGKHHVAGPLYDDVRRMYSAAAGRDRISADYVQTWNLRARFRNIGDFDVAQSAGIPLEAVRSYMAAMPADPEPRWTARDLIAFHTLNAQNASGPDAEAIVHEEMRQADKATRGRHPQIGRIKAPQYR